MNTTHAHCYTMGIYSWFFPKNLQVYTSIQLPPTGFWDLQARSDNPIPLPWVMTHEQKKNKQKAMTYEKPNSPLSACHYHPDPANHSERKVNEMTCYGRDYNVMMLHSCIYMPTCAECREARSCRDVCIKSYGIKLAVLLSSGLITSSVSCLFHIYFTIACKKARRNRHKDFENLCNLPSQQGVERPNHTKY